MTWTATFTQTTTVPRTGTVVAVFTNPNNPTDTFTYTSERLVEQGSLPAFVSAAKAALAAAVQERDKAKVISDRITAALNA